MLHLAAYKSDNFACGLREAIFQSLDSSRLNYNPYAKKSNFVNFAICGRA